jgi:hypothetical protein
MNGYGLVAWDVDSLLHQAGYVQEFELLQLGREFTVDAAFIDDTLVCLARGAGVGKYALYDLAPWLRGGAPVHLGDFGSLLFAAAECATPVRTPRGTRLAGIAYGGTLEVYDPYGTGHPLLSSLNIGGRSQEIVAAGETLWCGARVDNVQSLCAYRVVQDTPRLAAHVAAPGQVARLVRQGDLFAVACENAGFAWYRLHGDSLEELGRVGSGVVATDVELRGSRLYVADKLGGLKVYDLADPDTAVLVARNPGSAGWQGQFGSYGVDVGADGRIYLSDFNSGVFVIEPAGTGVEEGSGPARAKGGIGAILTRKAALRLAGTAAVYDVDGRRVGPRMVRLGVYFLGHPSRRGKAPPKTKVVVP